MTALPTLLTLPHPVLDLPPLDTALSPRTGVTRDHWEATADQLLLALRPHATAEYSQLRPPGRGSRSGLDSDGFEGFARSFLIAAALQHGRDGADPHGHAERYARGIAAGVDPDSAHPWPRPSQIPQAKVEACSIALGLDLTRPWLWDHLGDTTQAQVIAWFREVIGTRYPGNNWVWFRLMVLSFLRSVDDAFAPGPDGELSADARALQADVVADLRVHEDCADRGGWFLDGPERSVDHYNTWAFAVLPSLWLRMPGTALLEADGLLSAADHDRHRERLALFVRDALGLVGADGSPLIQGRSLIYRMAAAGSFWSAALAGLADGDAPVVAPGALRRAASGELAHFLGHGVPDTQGLLALGWHDAFPGMAQNYSGPGSPYWACKGFLGLILPPGHPVWTACEEPLPVERHDAIAVVDTPGWLVSRTASDGIVRVLNHGTDHGRTGVQAADAPLYARLGYSTATSPPMRGGGEVPVDSSVALVHPVHGESHRTGFDRLRADTAPLSSDHPVPTSGAGGERVGDTARESVGIGLSRQLCHWVEHPPDASTYVVADGGRVTAGALMTVASVVRGAGEVRILRAEQDTYHRVRVSGWPLSGPGEIREQFGGHGADGDPAGPSASAPGLSAAAHGPAADGASAIVTLGALHSSVAGMRGAWRGDVGRAQERVSPLGEGFAVPRLDGPPMAAGEVRAVHVVLRGDGTEAPAAPELEVTVDGDWILRWADGAVLHLDPEDTPDRR